MLLLTLIIDNKYVAEFTYYDNYSKFITYTINI